MADRFQANVVIVTRHEDPALAKQRQADLRRKGANIKWTWSAGCYTTIRALQMA
jgi:hypothetical protein